MLVSRTKISPEIIYSLSENDPSLTELDLSDQALDIDDLRELIKALQYNTSLKVLNLSGNSKIFYSKTISTTAGHTQPIQDNHVIVELMQCCKNITKLNLANCGVNGQCAIQLANCLKSNTTLIELDLGLDEMLESASDNNHAQYKKEAIQLIIKIIEKNRSLSSLNLVFEGDENIASLNSSDSFLMQQALYLNHTLRHFSLFPNNKENYNKENSPDVILPRNHLYDFIRKALLLKPFLAEKFVFYFIKTAANYDAYVERTERTENEKKQIGLLNAAMNCSASPFEQLIYLATEFLKKGLLGARSIEKRNQMYFILKDSNLSAEIKLSRIDELIKTFKNGVHIDDVEEKNRDPDVQNFFNAFMRRQITILDSLINTVNYDIRNLSRANPTKNFIKASLKLINEIDSMDFVMNQGVTLQNLMSSATFT